MTTIRNATHIKPRGDNVLIRRDQGDSVSAGGIHIPENHKERPMTGTVIACGPGVHRKTATSGDRLVWMPVTLKPGDRVLFYRHAGTPIDVQEGDGVTDIVEYMLMSEDRILSGLED